jgi:hypothetical protein
MKRDLVDSSWQLGATFCHYLQEWAARCSEISVSIYHSSKRHIEKTVLFTATAVRASHLNTQGRACVFFMHKLRSYEDSLRRLCGENWTKISRLQCHWKILGYSVCLLLWTVKQWNRTCNLNQLKMQCNTQLKQLLLSVPKLELSSSNQMMRNFGKCSHSFIHHILLHNLSIINML